MILLKDINNYMNNIALLDEYQDKKLEATDVTLLRDTKRQLQEFHETILSRFENLIDSGVTSLSSNLNPVISDKELKRAYNRRIETVGETQEPFFKEDLETDLATLANDFLKSLDVEVRKTETFQSFLYVIFINGYTQHETAQLLDINQGTVSQWMRDIIKMMRVRLLVVGHW